MKSDTHLMAYIALAAWCSLVLADHVGLLRSSRFEGGLLVLLYLASCHGLRRIRIEGIEMPGALPWAGALVLAWCLFVTHGTLLPANGPLVALLGAAIVAYPLVLLHGRHAGKMAVVVALPVFAFALGGLLSSEPPWTLGFVIAALECVWRGVALRTLPAWAYRRLSGP